MSGEFYRDNEPMELQAKMINSGGNRIISYRERLEMEATEMEKRAADIRVVLAAFDKNPELESLLNSMRRLGV